MIKVNDNENETEAERKRNMGNYDGIEKAQHNPGGVYVIPGVYRVKINSVKEKETRKGETAFIVELIVDESNNPQRAPGTFMTYMILLKHDSALGNIKHFCAAAWNIPEKDVLGAHPQAAIDEAKQPLANIMLRLVATNTKTKAGGDFTKCLFMPDHVGADGANKAASEQA